MYKNWAKFNQRIRQRGGKLINPFPKPKPGRVNGRGKREVTTAGAGIVANARRIREWERYIKDCHARGTTPKNIPSAIRRVLEEKRMI